MDFRKLLSSAIVVPFLLSIFVIGVILWKFIPKPESSGLESIETFPPAEAESSKELLVNPPSQQLDTSKEDDAAIQLQLDRDREDQKQTKYLKTKLEQTNLELEQEKALAEINKLRIENTGAFNDSALEGQKNLPEVKIEYIGGSSLKKEAIISISGTSYQVKEKSSPTDNIQVVSISDSSVTLHFSTPQALTKTIDYKPE